MKMKDITRRTIFFLLERRKKFIGKALKKIMVNHPPYSLSTLDYGRVNVDPTVFITRDSSTA